MLLLLVRHGPAEERDPARWPDDADRPLTPEGRRATAGAGRGLRVAGVEGPRVATSPLARARTTAEIVGRELGLAGSSATWPELAPEGTAEDVVRRLARAPTPRGGWMLVGHEPNLALVAGLLVTGEAVRPFRLAKAGAVRLDLPRGPVPGGATLDWLLTRKQLVRLGGGRRSR